MKNINRQKTCLNCDNFKRHYIMGTTDMFLTDYGHCKCPTKQCRLIEVYKENPACELWSPLCEVKTDSERLITAFEAIKKRLGLIELLLKDK